REVWFEVGAVLAVSIVPYVVSGAAAVVRATIEVAPLSSRPYWLMALEWIVFGACLVYVTLLPLHRNGGSWKKFGLSRPSALDLAIGVFLFFGSDMLSPLLYRWFDSDWRLTSRLSTPTPEHPSEFALRILLLALSGFAQELVSRAYLITRFERLL